MSGFRTVGSQIELIFRTNFPTFTPDQFNRALKDQQFLMTQGQIANALNPQAPPILIPMFSKGNLNAFIIPASNQIIFHILNTLELQPTMEEIKNVLIALNVVEDIITNINLNCTTTASSSTEPGANLTSLLRDGFIDALDQEIGSKLGLTSIRLSTSFPVEREGLQIVVEPLGTNPRRQYYIKIAYLTQNMRDFDAFIRKFGSNMVEGILEEISNVKH